MKKVIKAALWLFLSLALLIIIVIFETNDWPVGSSIAGLLAGLKIGRAHV